MTDSQRSPNTTIKCASFDVSVKIFPLFTLTVNLIAENEQVKHVKQAIGKVAPLPHVV